MELSMLEALNISATGFIVVLIILAILAVLILIVSKVIRSVEGGANKKTPKQKNIKIEKEEVKKDLPPVQNEKVESQSILPYGFVELYKTGYKTAASIMAIVSHESGIPLNKLDFKSIKLKDDVDLYKTDDKTAATIMAIVSHQTDIPLDRLAFKSIKLIEK